MAVPVRALDSGAYVLHAHPVVAYVHDEPGGADIAALLERARAGRTRLSISAVNAGEVLLAAERRGGPEAAFRTLDLLQVLPIDIVAVDLELASRAAYLKLRGGISLADCFSGALAMRDAVPLITGDPEFQRISDLVAIAWLPLD